MREKQTDEQLVSLAQNGDEQATEALIVRYGAFVRGRARSFFLVGGEAEDLIQEGFLGILYAIRNYKNDRDGKSFKNFAYTCVSSKLIDAVKKSRAKKNEPLNNSIPTAVVEGKISTALSPEETLIALDESDEIQRKMSAILSNFEFKIFTMYMNGYSCAEICETIGKSAKSVDNAVQRSRRKLLAAFLK